MENIEGLTINESEYDLENNKRGKIAVFIYTGGADPSKILNYAVNEYVGNNDYHELIDSNLDNPWMRVIISDINDMKQEPFTPRKHRITNNL